ncbi:hypothetical protein [Methylobacterium gnaphalii]|uniref:Uncharacterized protein n=1 Tax=Methylobacterium gnaphalii TaxID=1010610 RepID=A0A512JS69_9HYPH|nr:hypothetical protein [Methylobacterium gnaphalii]GEP12804.1 hypothetical protein MGN01_46490 [Methylobacterium gnaphalii]GJD71518.1 hypothetical protein MMMDOFMJ_4479 [Methylobacterium gnaphalii]GLS50637.1 hypothetical protein GCM10007885_34900 [Methylobacterium gnaphalii]
MRLAIFGAVALALVGATPARAQATANGFEAVASPAMPPFMRAADPFLLPATSTPQQYLITQPEKTASYRGVNSCLMADVRIKTVKASAPITSTPTPYPGVSKVTSPTATVSEMTGTRFMARWGEWLGSTPNPMGGQQRIISIMLVPIPGTSTDISGLTCIFELGYGNGG